MAHFKKKKKKMSHDWTNGVVSNQLGNRNCLVYLPKIYS